MFLSPIQLSAILLLSAAVAGSAADIINQIIQNLSYTESVLQPTISLVYKVDLPSLQQYIDPQFKVVSPYNNNSAYIVIVIGNNTAYSNVGTCYHCATISYLQSLVIYTSVEFENKRYFEVLHASFNSTLSAIAGSLYQSPPYGTSLMNPGVQFSVNNQTGDYRFSSSAFIFSKCNFIKTAAIDVTFNFNSNQVADNTNPRTLAGFYLGSEKNTTDIQSSSRKCGSTPPTPSSRISKTYILNTLYTTIINCTNVNVASTYIKNTIGNIVGLNEANPVACFYIPYQRYDSVIA